MLLPLYKKACDDTLEIKTLTSPNLGLWYERFFNKYDSSWKVKDESKKNWIIDSVAKSKGQSNNKLKDLLKQQTNRMTALVLSLEGQHKVYKTSWHFVTGLGLNHPVENGFSWHPTLGVPYLQGAAVKGLLRGWIEQWTDEHEILAKWFGKQDEAGDLIFFDALPIDLVKLTADIMTPHMGEWYEKGGEIESINEHKKLPADWHNPVPIPFLAVKEGQFMFSLASRSRNKDNVANAFKHLSDALDILGAGAKTAVGYGRFEEDQSWIKEQQQIEEEKEKKRQQAESAAKKEAELSQLSPLKREIKEIIDADKSSDEDYLVILKKLEEGHWSDKPQQREVAKYLESLMRDKKFWREESAKKKKEKDEPYQRTLRVKKFLGEGE